MIKKPYPRMLYPHQTIDRVKRIANNSMEEETFTGRRMNEDGTPFEDPDGDHGPVKPPTVEMVMEHGYARAAAEEIVRREQHRFEMGYPPYGTNEEPSPTPVSAPAEEPAAKPEPEEV